MKSPDTRNPQLQDKTDQTVSRRERIGMTAAVVGAVPVLAAGFHYHNQADGIEYRLNPSMPEMRVGLDTMQGGNESFMSDMSWTDALNVTPKQEPSDLPPIVQHYKQ